MAGGNEEPKAFPHGYIAMGNGDLMQVSNFNVKYANNGKAVHTQRVTVAGFVIGKPVANASFTYEIDEDGPEHNYMRLVQRGTIKKLRVKIPGGVTFMLTGIFTVSGLDAPLEDSVKGSCEFVAKMNPQ